MTASEYIKRHQMTWHAFSIYVGVAYTTVRRLKRTNQCSVETAKKIEAATGGDVGAAELLGLRKPRVQRRRGKP